MTSPHMIRRRMAATTPLVLALLLLGSNLSLAALGLLTRPLQRFTLRQVQQIVLRTRVRCRRVSNRTRRLG